MIMLASHFTAIISFWFVVETYLECDETGFVQMSNVLWTVDANVVYSENLRVNS